MPLLLHFEDRNSMAHSIEARVPYLDYRLVEFCINIPSQYKFKGALTKEILREAMEPYLPSEIYKRTNKVGFQTPIEQYISQDKELSGKMQDYLYHSDLWNSGWIDQSKYEPRHLFPLYSLARFMEIYS